MIVRILGEGQYDVNAEHLEEIEGLDAKLAAAIEADDEEAFATVLQEVIDAVRRHSPVDPETIVPSQLTIPHEGATVSEVRELLAQETAGADEGDAGGAGIVAGEAGEG